MNCQHLILATILCFGAAPSNVDAIIATLLRRLEYPAPLYISHPLCHYVTCVVLHSLAICHFVPRVV